ncbi:MAG TPA: GGDEF domain-containing protein [Albitalea sp.]|nr:GGDEF domain-containing protein [Albitalea sp.]
MPTSTPEPASPEPGRLQRLVRLGLRLGPLRATLALTLLAAVLAVLISQLVVIAVGHGDYLVVALSALLAAGLLAPLPAALLLRLAFELTQARQQLSVRATQDELTGVHNRPHFMTLVAREWDRARRYNTAAALLLIDADHFRRVNEAHGQLCGDELLRRIAQTTGASLRQPDVLARFGGEEFIVFLPHTDLLGALDVAERIRSQVQALSVAWQGTPVGTTVSIGMAPMRAELPSLDWMIHEADTALCVAKADGCNCVRTLPFEASRSGDVYHIDRR